MGYFDGDTEIIANGWGGYLPTKAHEVEKLIAVAENCGIDKDSELFDRVIGIVYGQGRKCSCNHKRGPSASLAQAAGSTGEINPGETHAPNNPFNIGGVESSVDINKLSDSIVAHMEKAVGHTMKGGMA